MTALEKLSDTLEQMSAKNTLEREKMLKSRILKRYCNECGVEMNRVPYTNGYDSLTGKPIVQLRFTCPMRSSFWLFRMFDRHQVISGEC